MFKNRYVFWGFVGAWVIVLLSIGGWLLLGRGNGKDAVRLAGGSAAGASHDATTNSPQTIDGSGNIGTGITIDGSTGGGQQSSTSSSNSANSILDPRTFPKYDSYKDAQTASYIDLQKGDGATLSEGKTAVVVYRGWLTDGTLFDQSHKGADGKLQAFNFVLGEHKVISGWEQGLAGMQVNGVRFLIIPPVAGYGAQGQGPIPANSVLLFQVQLVQVQ